MRPAQKARERLKGNWKQAVGVQVLLLLSGGVLTAAELGVMFSMGIRLNQGISVMEVLSGQSNWWRLGILLGAVVVDLFLLSPLRAGQSLFYRRVAFPAPPEPPPMVERLENGVIRLEADREAPEEKSVPVSVVGRFYQGKAYGKAVRWRLTLWIYRSLWSLLWYIPGALALGYGEYLLRVMDAGALRDVTLVCSGFLGLFSMIAGFLAVELTMLRWMPAQYLLEEESTVRGAMKRSRQLMKGQTGDMAWLYMGFSGWLFACFTVIPYFYAAPLFLATRAEAVRRLMEKEARSASSQADRRVRRFRPSRRRTASP